jgi:minor extracellular serine protease Vpr
VLNGGSQGGNGAALNGPEYDGYLTLTAGSEKLTVPWHVLPRRAASTEAEWQDRRGGAMEVKLKNSGQEVGQYEVFSLMATSPRLPASALPNPGDNFAAVDLRAVGTRYLTAAVCGEVGGCLEFAISTFGRRAHPVYPAGFEVAIDTNADGKPDYFVTNREAGAFASSGQTLIFVQKAGATTASAFFYADADLNSGNMTMTVPMSALGLAVGTTINFSVDAGDNYFSGKVSDAITGMRFTPGAARFNVVGLPFGEVPARGNGEVVVTRGAALPAKSSEAGLLVMHRRNTEREADILRSN